jgi:hypothetical protein
LVGESSWWRKPASLGERDGGVGRGPEFVSASWRAVFLAVLEDPRTTVKGVKGRLASEEAGATRSKVPLSFSLPLHDGRPATFWFHSFAARGGTRFIAVPPTIADHVVIVEAAVEASLVDGVIASASSAAHVESVLFEPALLTPLVTPLVTALVTSLVTTSPLTLGHEAVTIPAFAHDGSGYVVFDTRCWYRRGVERIGVRLEDSQITRKCVRQSRY